MAWVFGGKKFGQYTYEHWFDDEFAEHDGSNKKYDVFLFDADGTLFDYDKAEENALKAVFTRCAFEYSAAARMKYREINFNCWKCYERGEITKEELQRLRFSRLFDEIGISYDADDFNKKYLIELGKGSFLIEGALQICEEIVSFNKKIYIVTNGILSTQKPRIENSQINKFISAFFVSEHIGYQKPDPLYFEYVFSKIPDLDKSKILLTGDSLTADIAGGNNAYIDTCWFNPAGEANNTDIAPVYEIRNLLELRRFF